MFLCLFLLCAYNDLDFELQVGLNQETLNHLASFLINCIKICKKWTVLNILRALGSTLYENGSLCEQVFDKSMGEEMK